MLLAIVILLVLAAPSFASPNGSEQKARPVSEVFSQKLLIGLQSEYPLGRVQDVEVDERGNVYVLDAGFVTVRKFDKAGNHLMDLGREGEAPGEFYSPSCLALGPDGDLFVGGYDPAISILDANGNRDRSRSFKKHFPGMVYSMDCDSSGNVYLCGIDIMDQKMVHKYSGEHSETPLTHLKSFCDSYAVGQDIDTRLEESFAIGFITVKNDKIYYLQAAPQAVRIFNTEGALERKLVVRETPPPPPPVIKGSTMQLVYPPLSDSIIVFEDGTLMVAYFVRGDGEDDPGESFLDVYDPNGQQTTTLTYSGYFSPKCIDAEGNIYVSMRHDEVPVVAKYSVDFHSH